ncbi:phosphatase PAP2 family protein [Phaeacidiphilus oryzae]|uniref:phosphatase PAP2 family protein n=1 Tax=Phaeacidiphilus oryzae TaxID=348818 RepID=UPI000691DBDC|nr:phosphatase PAP2 family protein [Phaeacidiphilus oryzae]
MFHTLLGRLRLRPHPQGRPLFWQFELLLVAVLYFAYDGSRLLVSGGLPEARHNGRALLDAERWAHLSPEHWLNQLFTANDLLAVPADFLYASLHYLVTPAVLIWLWVSHHGEYRRARTWLGIATVAGLVGFVLFPTAPPRLLEASYGFIDTMSQHADVGWWGAGDASVPNGMASMTNEYAAMPSLHLGWALWCGIQLVRHASDITVRVLGVLYPLVIAFVVMGTANHYLLDCVAGAAVMVASSFAAAPLLRLLDALRLRAVAAVLRARGATSPLPEPPHRPAMPPTPTPNPEHSPAGTPHT